MSKNLFFVLVLFAFGMAFAQTSPSQTAVTTAINSLSFGDMINTVQTGVVTSMTQSSAGLYTILAIIGGFFFVWNRVRSLW